MITYSNPKPSSLSPTEQRSQFWALPYEKNTVISLLSSWPSHVRMKAKLQQVIKDLESSHASIQENFDNGVVNGFTDQP